LLLAVCANPQLGRSHTGAWLAIVSSLLALSLAGAARAASLDPLDRVAITMAHPERAVLLSVTAAGRRLIAVGAAGLIVVSDDYGDTWAQVPSPVSVTLTAVAFANERVGWAVGHSGVILGTTDSGQTWVRQYDGRRLIAALKSGAPEDAPVHGDTPEAGSNVVLQMIDDGPDKPLLALYVANSTEVMIVGSYGLLLVTHDGGHHWEPRLDLTAAASGKHLYAVRRLGVKVFYAGEGGGLYWSDGIEKPLKPIVSPYAGTFFGLVSTREGGLIAYGLRGHAVASHDEGHTWTPLDLGANGSINAGARLVDGQIALATQAGEILIGENGDTPFKHVAVAAAPAPYSDLVEIPTGLVAVGFRVIVRIALPADRP
jgi:photosystem II stability/assembly factor-like uncharacterized protein